MSKIRISGRQFLITVICISVVAFLLRLLLGYTLYNNQSPHIHSPLKGTDMRTYLRFARIFSEGKWEDAYYFQPLYYTWFLGFIFKIFGPSVLVVIWIQSLLGGLTVYLCGILGGRVGGKKVGILAALCLCFYRNHIMYSPYALIATLQTFLITLCFYLFFRFLQKGNTKTLILAGLTTGLSILARGNCLLVLPVMIIWIIVKYKNTKKEMVKLVCLLLITAYSVQMPFSIHNYNLMGEWTGPATAGDVALANGNNPQAPPGTDEGTAYIDNTDALKYWHELKDREVKPISLKSSVIDWVINDPMSWIELKFRTVLLFFSNKECYNNTSYNITSKYAPWFKAPFLTFGFFGALYLCSLFSKFNLKKFRFTPSNFLLVSSLVYVLSIIIFYMMSRYRLPIVPIMIVLGLNYLIRFIHCIKRRPAKVFGKRIALIVTMFLVTFCSFDFYRANCEARLISMIKNESHAYPRGGAKVFRDSNSKLWGGYKDRIIEKEFTFHKGFKSENLVGLGYVNSVLYLNLTSEYDLAELEVEVHHREKVFKKKILISSAEEGNFVPVELKTAFLEKEEWFKIKLKTNTPLKLSYTTQRDYWRSIEEDTPLIGEWDVVLVIADYPKK